MTEAGPTLFHSVPPMTGFLVKRSALELACTDDENLAEYEAVWEDERRPVRLWVRRPWGRVVRPLFRARWFIGAALFHIRGKRTYPSFPKPAWSRHWRERIWDAKKHQQSILWHWRNDA